MTHRLGGSLLRLLLLELPISVHRLSVFQFRRSRLSFLFFFSLSLLAKSALFLIVVFTFVFSEVDGHSLKALPSPFNRESITKNYQSRYLIPNNASKVLNIPPD